MSNEALNLLDSRLSRLRSDHENRLLFAGNAPLGMFDPMRKATYGIAMRSYVVAAATELQEYATRVHSEVILVVEQLLLPLSQETKAAAVEVASQKFDKDLYPKRLTIFEESMIRQGQRCGLRVDEWGMRIDLELAKHSVGTATLISRAMSKLADDLELVRLRSAPGLAAERLGAL